MYVVEVESIDGWTVHSSHSSYRDAVEQCDMVHGRIVDEFGIEIEKITFELSDNREFYFVYTQFDFFELGDDPLLVNELWNDFYSRVDSIVESYGFDCRRPASSRSACHAWKGYRVFDSMVCGILGTFDYVPSDTLELLADEIHDAYKEIIKPHLGDE